MYLVSSGFSFKPTSSSSSSSSTQFSQEWARRKVVVKHSIKSNQNPQKLSIFNMWPALDFCWYIFFNLWGKLALVKSRYLSLANIYIWVNYTFQYTTNLWLHQSMWYTTCDTAIELTVMIVVNDDIRQAWQVSKNLRWKRILCIHYAMSRDIS